MPIYCKESPVGHFGSGSFSQSLELSLELNAIKLYFFENSTSVIPNSGPPPLQLIFTSEL